AGADRYETSLLVAKTAYPNPDKVHAVPGWNWPDALSAASFNDGPILLIPYGKTQNQIEDQIHAHLGPAPKYVTLIGALQSVWNKHHKYGYDGEPLGREDRYGTSFSISMYAQEIGAHYQHFLVSGTNWPDGLSAASFPNGIIHLVQPGHPEKWRNWYQLEPTNSTIIGGPGALPTTTAPQPQPQQQGTGNNQNLGDCEAGPNYPNGRYWKEGWPTTYYDEYYHQTIKLCYNEPVLAFFHDVSAIEDEHARLLNEHRVSLGLHPLQRDPELDAFARKNCERVGTGDLGHDRAFMLTELGRRVGENATGDASGGFHHPTGITGLTEVTKQGNPAVTTLQSLLDSPPHRANIERSSYTRFGVGVSVYPSSSGNPIVTLFEEFE
ncbi:cell wall-binding repeat-containing protein, partial [uncultured Mobiluncus sp.]|uniref:cell wall-binding repeat-containing protein n=1 Tax=uncultured Mobiluncus sp. TaxID=293425 RepID=UPI0025E2BA8F